LNTVVVMFKNHHPRDKARLFLIMDALAPLAGILLASAFTLPEQLLAYLLAFFAGEFLYIGAGSLLPETQSHGTFKTMAAMAFGVALIALLTAMIQ
jgi:ZIP family zinc transporter